MLAEWSTCIFTAVFQKKSYLLPLVSTVHPVVVIFDQSYQDATLIHQSMISLLFCVLHYHQLKTSTEYQDLVLLVDRLPLIVIRSENLTSPKSYLYLTSLSEPTLNSFSCGDTNGEGWTIVVFILVNKVTSYYYVIKAGSKFTTLQTRLKLPTPRCDINVNCLVDF